MKNLGNWALDILAGLNKLQCAGKTQNYWKYPL